MDSNVGSAFGFEAVDLIMRMRSGEILPKVELQAPVVHTNAERLAYYRAHGLTCCDDYPGGDEQFERAVPH